MICATYWNGPGETGDILPVVAWATIGSALIILPISEGRYDPVKSLLASLPLRSLGLISYSLYLWHWPILFFARTYQSAFSPMASTKLDPVSAGVCIALALVLAIASYRLIELPFRRRRIRWPHAFGIAGTSIAAVTAAGLVALWNGGFPSRLPQPALDAMSAAGAYDSLHRKCFDPPGNGLYAMVEVAERDELCIVGPGDGHKVDYVIWGDSHGFALSPMLLNLGDKFGRTGMLANYAGCPPLIRCAKCLG